MARAFLVQPTDPNVLSLPTDGICEGLGWSAGKSDGQGAEVPAAPVPADRRDRWDR